MSIPWKTTLPGPSTVRQRTAKFVKKYSTVFLIGGHTYYLHQIQRKFIHWRPFQLNAVRTVNEICDSIPYN